MSGYLRHLQEQLLDTSAMIGRLEQRFVDHDDDVGLSLTLSSLEKRRRDLEQKFSKAAYDRELDICRYRIIPKSGQATAKSIGKSIIAFQDWLSVTYSACVKGRKRRATFDASTAKATQLDFGYAFAGSVGFVFTMPNQRLLFAGTKLDEAVERLREMTNADGVESIQALAQEMGPGPVTAMYRWVKAHHEAGFAIDFQWRRLDGVRSKFLVQETQFSRLEKAIGKTSGKKVREFEADGLLVGADLERRTFHLKVGEENIEGHFAADAEDIETVKLPRRYRAQITERTITTYSTGRQKVSYSLSHFEPIDDDPSGE